MGTSPLDAVHAAADELGIASHCMAAFAAGYAAALRSDSREDLLIEHNKMTRFLEQEGYRYCDTPACNCESWHRVRSDSPVSEGKTIDLMDALVTDLKKREAEASTGGERDEPDLRGFVVDLLKAHRGWSGPGDIDGGTFQELAEKHGVFVVEHATEPCGEACDCAEFGDWPVDCYRTHPALLPRQVEGDDNPNGGTP